MVFTPLLASTTVGTLDPRSVTVHITQIQKALHQPQNQYYMASCVNVDTEKQEVECDSDGVTFYVGYDKLAICTGSQAMKSPSPIRSINCVLGKYVWDPRS